MTKKEINLRIRILLSTYDALIGRISSSVRMITVDWKEDYYHIIAYFDRPTTEEDLEDYKCIVAEILAHFPKILDAIEEVKFVNKPLNKLPTLKEMIFLRKGELDM